MRFGIFLILGVEGIGLDQRNSTEIITEDLEAVMNDIAADLEIIHGGKRQFCTKLTPN